MRLIKHDVHPVKLSIIMLLSILSYFLPLPLAHEAKIVFSLLILAALLWVTETIPLFLTSLIATTLIVLFNIFTLPETVVKFADPIIILLFGGFLIAHAMQKVELDKEISLILCKKLKDNKYALLGMMFCTAFLSMWISNTASTVVMIPIALGIIHTFKAKLPNFGKAAVLGIAYSANIGGVGTIIGSPPNAIVVAKLAEYHGIHLSFLDWMKATMPLVIVLVPAAWFILIKIFPFEKHIIKHPSKIKKLTIDQEIFLGVFLFTIALWLTTSWHGLSSALIALMSACFLFIIRLLEPKDLHEINYSILFLFGGGLVMGSAMLSTGLSSFIAQKITFLLINYPMVVILLGIALFAILLSAFVSNTATAAILVPLLLPVADLFDYSPVIVAMVAGVAVSFSYLLPVGTPPNAIAYASRKITIKDMLKAGGLLTVISAIALVIVAKYWWTGF